MGMFARSIYATKQIINDITPTANLTGRHEPKIALQMMIPKVNETNDN